MTSPIRSIRRRPPRSASAASPTARRIRRIKTGHWPADLKWLKSAATARASISPTRFTLPGTSSFIRTASAVGWSNSMPSPTMASISTRSFSWRALIIAFTRSTLRAAIARAIPIVFRESPLALADAVRIGGISRPQSSHGLALRRSAGLAGTAAWGGPSRSAAYRSGTCALGWDHHRLSSSGRGCLVTLDAEIWRRRNAVRLWVVSPFSIPPPELGRHARRFSGPHRLVLHYVLGPRRGIDADPAVSETGSNPTCHLRHSHRTGSKCRTDLHVQLRHLQHSLIAGKFSCDPYARPFSCDRPDRPAGLSKARPGVAAPRLVQPRPFVDGRLDGDRPLHPLVVSSKQAHTLLAEVLPDERSPALRQPFGGGARKQRLVLCAAFSLSPGLQSGSPESRRRHCDPLSSRAQILAWMAAAAVDFSYQLNTFLRGACPST